MHWFVRMGVLTLLTSASCRQRTAIDPSDGRIASDRRSSSNAGASVRESTTVCSTEGAWSSEVQGLRGRLKLTTPTDSSSLGLVLELEQVGAPQEFDLHWQGPIPHGMLIFRLETMEGVEVPEPAWRFGGNEPGGIFRISLHAGERLQFAIGAGVLPSMQGQRALRIGAFWGRSLPGGAHTQLRARLVGAEAVQTALLVRRNADGTLSAVQENAAANVRAWRGILELPPVCIP